MNTFLCCLIFSYPSLISLEPYDFSQGSNQTENGKGALAYWELSRKVIVIFLGQSLLRIIFYILLL